LLNFEAQAENIAADAVLMQIVLAGPKMIAFREESGAETVTLESIWTRMQELAK
jgi:hypothetical protein